jgi:uncharacterized protein YodC (DUF2158 family)
MPSRVRSRRPADYDPTYGSGPAFVPGDVVRLKSGGPDMTINRVYEDFRGVEMVHCQWFDGLRLETNSFPVDSVELAR